MGMLFLNSLKGLKQKKIQMISVIILILLSTGIFTGISIALDRMEERYANYLVDQNVEDFSYDVKVDYGKDFTKEDVDGFLKNELKDIPSEQKSLVLTYRNLIGHEDMISKEDLEKIYEAIEYIFTYNQVNLNKTMEVSKKIDEKYNVHTEIEKAKVVTENEHTHKAILYKENNKINMPYIIEGELPKENNEVTILPNYAEKNDYKVGNYIIIGEKSYKISGIAYSPNHIYPLITMNNPMIEDKKTNILYMNENTFDEFVGTKEYVPVATFNDKNTTKTTTEIEEMFKDDKDVKIDFMSMARQMRIKMFDMEIKNDRIFVEYFMYLLLAVAMFVIYVITKKRIQEEKKQIGVLKALGYKANNIAISYLVYPVVGGLIGGTIGYLVGMLSNTSLAELFRSYFNVPIDVFSFDFKYILYVIILPTLVLTIVSYIISLVMLKKRALSLLKEGSDMKVNPLSKVVEVITRKMKFKDKFKYMLATRSIGKLFTVMITSFSCGLLIVFTLITMDMFSSMIMSTFESFDFDYQVSYMVDKVGESNKEDLILKENGEITKVNRDGEIEELVEEDEKIKRPIEKLKENKEAKEEDKAKKRMTLALHGIDKSPKFIALKNEEGEKILPKLYTKDNAIIINKNVSDVLEVGVGDILITKVYDEVLELEIVAIDNSFMGNTCYMNRNALCDSLDYKENTYNSKFTTDSRYSNVNDLDKEEMDNVSGIFAIKDLKQNMEKNFETAETIIYIIIAFAGIMAFIIIGVIANVIVEENKKTISLMKVCGYKNKQVSQMVLNIYTPFVIIAYLLSIPAMVSILKLIAKVLLEDMTFSLVISFSFTKCIIGLVALLVAYYFAIYMSRKILNKVPLSVALKRE